MSTPDLKIDPWMCMLETVAEDMRQNLALEGDDLQVEPTCLRLSSQDVLLPVMSFLRHDAKHQYSLLIDLCGVDDLRRTPRFDVVYHLLSLPHNTRIRLKIAIDAETSVPSVSSIFPAAGWWEREAYDMYGITFSDHPDLRRILTDYNFEGYPLRKDFPLMGFTEVRYDADAQTIVSEPVHLDQPYRAFEYVGPWKGCMPSTEVGHD